MRGSNTSSFVYETELRMPSFKRLLPPKPTGLLALLASRSALYERRGAKPRQVAALSTSGSLCRPRMFARPDI
ncbi:hypothetical protein AYJ54_45780 [Bradyrhizobium centrolobii]|uniref:Uncharacterized protein n=1 Tax=Bradyrhizobium centrolobii TaxID=1505087 RepID=A0A176YZ22_9BRAD|nr:hypothetical protein AYJ54_45780 [Bradyrhizobium centrolobii]